MTSNPPSPDGHQAYEYVKTNYDVLQVLPHRGAFTLAALTLDRRDIQHLSKQAVKHEIIEPIGSVKLNNGSRNVYTVTDSGRRLLRMQAEETTFVQMPCGHSGFTNERGTEYLQCKQCGGRFTKADVGFSEPA